MKCVVWIKFPKCNERFKQFNTKNVTKDKNATCNRDEVLATKNVQFQLLFFLGVAILLALLCAYLYLSLSKRICHTTKSSFKRII